MCTSTTGRGVEKRLQVSVGTEWCPRASFKKWSGKKTVFMKLFLLNLANSLTLADVTVCGGILSTEALPEKLAFSSNFLTQYFSFFLKKQNLNVIKFWVQCLPWCAWAFSICGGFACCRAETLEGGGFSTWWCVGLLPWGMWNLPRPRIEAMSPALPGRFSPLDHQASPIFHFKPSKLTAENGSEPLSPFLKFSGSRKYTMIQHEF